MNQIKFDHHNRLWLATTKGVYRRDGQIWTAFNKDNSGLSFNNVTCLAFDSNDRVWCGTFGGGLFLFDGSRWTQYTTGNSQLPSDYVGFVAVDNNDVLWLNCRDPQYPDKYGLEFGFGLTRFDGTRWNTYNRSNSPIPSNCLYDIKIDADNNKWLAAAGDVGIASFNGTDWHTYNVDNSGIAFNEVTRITIDSKRDLIWLTHYTSNNGNGLSVARLNNHNTTVQSPTAPNIVPTTNYDLSGRQIVNPIKGIYIKQGKKFVKE
jgi:ligand-binding sensor domain-containing protein